MAYRALEISQIAFTVPSRAGGMPLSVFRLPSVEILTIPGTFLLKSESGASSVCVHITVHLLYQPLTLSSYNIRSMTCSAP